MRRKKEYVPRDPIRDYFPLPNEIFSLGLSTGEIAVYAYLMYCEDRKTFQCHPSYSTIGKAVKITTKTVAKYVKSLQKRGLIDTEPTTVTLKDGRKHNGNPSDSVCCGSYVSESACSCPVRSGGTEVQPRASGQQADRVHTEIVSFVRRYGTTGRNAQNRCPD